MLVGETHHFRKHPNDRFFLVGIRTLVKPLFERSVSRDKIASRNPEDWEVCESMDVFLETYFGISFYAMYSITFPLKTVTNKLLSCSSFLSINFRLRLFHVLQFPVSLKGRFPNF